VKPTDLNNFDMGEKLGCPNGEYVDRIFEFYDTKIMKKLSPVPGAVESIHLLGEEHEIIALTARTDYLEQITQNSIDKYFRDSISDLYLTGEWVGKSDSNKAKICSERGVDLLVDDRPKYCYEAIEAGVKSILFNLNGNYGWGDQEINKAGLYHANSWKEIVSTIESINK